MKSLFEIYESINDSDEQIDSREDRTLFYSYFAECFVKVFGKIDRKTSAQVFNKLGLITVGKLGAGRQNKWIWDSWRVNDFISKLKEMRKLLRKRYKKADFSIDSHNMTHVLEGMWMCKYLINWIVDKDNDEDFSINWNVDVTKDDSFIIQLMFHSLSEYALKDKELLKIIDDNI